MADIFEIKNFFVGGLSLLVIASMTGLGIGIYQVLSKNIDLVALLGYVAAVTVAGSLFLFGFGYVVTEIFGVRQTQ